MVNEPPNDVRELWQNQQVPGGRMSAADVRKNAELLQRAARRRVVAFYAMGVANAGIPLVLMWFLPQLRLGLAYLAVTAAVLVTFVRRRSGFQKIPPELAPAEGRAFYRHLLERERDFKRDSVRWFTTAPALNIVVLSLVYVSSPFYHGTPGDFAFLGSILVAHAVLLTRIASRLGREARGYQEQLDRLDAEA